ncbi:MAG: radical SAM protein [Oscillospiraceae bacterium]|jgi:molybdenum cofactor biosynthesis enzyme MoaA|nr:radical SAM protein [Oscillospiraceae bacterium]
MRKIIKNIIKKIFYPLYIRYRIIIDTLNVLAKKQEKIDAVIDALNAIAKKQEKIDTVVDTLNTLAIKQEKIDTVIDSYSYILNLLEFEDNLINRENIIKDTTSKDVFVPLKHYNSQFSSIIKLSTKVRLEACSICQLRCTGCNMFEDEFFGKGYLKIQDFEKFILDNNFIKHIELSNKGEIFLNPDLIHIIKHAFENNVLLYADNGVNFNNVSEEMLDALVKYQFRSIGVSIHGSSQESYSRYMVNGNFDSVIKNIKKLNTNKKKYNSAFPKLSWRYVLMEETEKEEDILRAKELARELDMRIDFGLTFVKGFDPKNPEMLSRETGLNILVKEEQEKEDIKHKKHYFGDVCLQIWKEPTINWDGRLLGCCIGHTKSDFGINVFKIGLKEAINSENYIHAKKMLLGKVDGPGVIKNIRCTNCSVYKDMKKEGLFIK